MDVLLAADRAGPWDWFVDGGTLLVALVALAVSIASFWVAQRRATSDQAHSVSGWVSRDRKLHVLNASDAPVYQWHVVYRLGDADLGRSSTRTIVPPGSENPPLTWSAEVSAAFDRLRDAASPDARPETTDVAVEVHFTDANGRRWVRTVEGELRRSRRR